MSKPDIRTLWERELADLRDRAERRDARRNETLTRGEMLDALEDVARDYGCAGNHDSDLIADAFRALAERLS